MAGRIGTEQEVVVSVIGTQGKPICADPLRPLPVHFERFLKAIPVSPPTAPLSGRGGRLTKYLLEGLTDAGA
jgi:hypothetical protein